MGAFSFFFLCVCVYFSIPDKSSALVHGFGFYSTLKSREKRIKICMNLNNLLLMTDTVLMRK